MSLRHGLLGLLSCDGSMTGYELDKFFKHSLAHFWQAKTSQIYRELSAMEERGWLTSERIFQEEKPNKRVYSITDEGKAELVSWLTLPDPAIEGGVKSTFLMRIFLSGEVGKENALKLLKEFRDTCTAFAPKLKQIQEEIALEEAEHPKHAVYWKLTAMQGEISSKAGIEWADKAIEILEKFNEKENEKENE